MGFSKHFLQGIFLTWDSRGFPCSGRQILCSSLAPPGKPKAGTDLSCSWIHQFHFSLLTLPVKNTFQSGDDSISFFNFFLQPPPPPPPSPPGFPKRLHFWNKKQKKMAFNYMFSHEQPFLKVMRPESPLWWKEGKEPLQREKEENPHLKILFGHIFCLHMLISLVCFRLSELCDWFSHALPVPGGEGRTPWI